MGTYVHGDKTDGDDEAILILTFEGGAVGLAEESWTKPGGMDDRAEVFGSEGQAYADVLYGNALRAYSRRGTAMPSRRPGPPRAGRSRSTRRSGTTASRRRWSTSSPASATGTPPRENGHDGRAVVEAVHALYASAARAGASSCRSPATRPGRSITGSRAAAPAAALSPIARGSQRR